MNEPDIQRLGVSLRAMLPPDFRWEAAVREFDAWRDGDADLMHAADYAHVLEGGGVVLAGHARNYALEVTAGRPAFQVVTHKLPPGSLAEKAGALILAAFRAAARFQAGLAAHHAIGYDPGDLRFFVRDRLQAPNTPATETRLRPALEAGLAAAFAHLGLRPEFAVSRPASPHAMFGLEARARTPIPFDAVVRALGAGR